MKVWGKSDSKITSVALCVTTYKNERWTWDNRIILINIFMFILVVNLVHLGQDASQFISKKYDCGDNYSTTVLIHFRIHEL